MLKELINECRIAFSIKTEGAVLIKGKKFEEITDTSLQNQIRSDDGIRSGQKDPDTVFIRTFRNNRFEPFIPGSSLKGVLRNQCEKIIRTLLPLDFADESKLGCCNPFITKKESDISELSCSDRFQLRKDNEEKISTTTFFRESCPICKLYGNTFLQSRIRFPDGYSSTHKMQKRDGVGIDRYSGGSAMLAGGGAKFDFEVEENAVFKFEDIIIRNFDLWQLGLLAYVFQDFEDKLIKIGFGKSRGLGKVSGKVEKLEIIYYGSRKPDANKLAGVAHFIGNSEYYTYTEKTQLIREINLPQTTRLTSNGYRHTYSFSNPSEAKAILNSTAEAFSKEDNTGYLNGSVYSVPAEMRKTYLEQLKAQTATVSAGD
jgi:CRISPR-associated RAMP protein (TIGR02581 family)